MRKGGNLPRKGRLANPDLPKNRGDKEKLVEQTLDSSSTVIFVKSCNIK
jgi:hypothetical protein